MKAGAEAVVEALGDAGVFDRRPSSIGADWITDDLIKKIAEYVLAASTRSARQADGIITITASAAIDPIAIRELIAAAMPKQRPVKVLTDEEIVKEARHRFGGYLSGGQAVAIEGTVRWAIEQSNPDYASMEKRNKELEEQLVAMRELVSHWQGVIDDTDATKDWEFGDVRWRSRLYDRLQEKDARIADLEKQLAIANRNLERESDRVLKELAENSNMVPRSRIDAIETELKEAGDKLERIQKSARAEIARLEHLLGDAQLETRTAQSERDVLKSNLPKSRVCRVQHPQTDAEVIAAARECVALDFDKDVPFVSKNIRGRHDRESLTSRALTLLENNGFFNATIRRLTREEALGVAADTYNSTHPVTPEIIQAIRSGDKTMMIVEIIDALLAAIYGKADASLALPTKPSGVQANRL
jgi:hypothetical protein